MKALFMQGPTQFHIPASRKDEALSLLQLYYNRTVPPDERGDEEHLAPLCCLEEGLFTFGWEAAPGCGGDIEGITYTDKYLSDQDGALEAISCCVTAGSSIITVIEHEGQCGFDVEQWLFDGVRMHRLEAGLLFADLPDRNPDRKSIPQLLVGLQKGLSLSLQYLLSLLEREPELALAFERQFLLECGLSETHTSQDTGTNGQARYLLGALSATMNHLLEAADAGDS
jgi:hypothetical protein